MDGIFLGLARLLLRISLGNRPQEIPQSSPASPRKTPSFPPLLLRLTQARPGLQEGIIRLVVPRGARGWENKLIKLIFPNSSFAKFGDAHTFLLAVTLKIKVLNYAKMGVQ